MERGLSRFAKAKTRIMTDFLNFLNFFNLCSLFCLKLKALSIQHTAKDELRRFFSQYDKVRVEF
jgi:hypothetical protein